MLSVKINKALKRYKNSVSQLYGDNLKEYLCEKISEYLIFCEKDYREELFKEKGVSRSCCVPHPMVEAEGMNLYVSNLILFLHQSKYLVSS